MIKKPRIPKMTPRDWAQATMRKAEFIFVNRDGECLFEPKFGYRKHPLDWTTRQS